MALGNVSIPPFTRAEVKQLVNQKSYPEGQLVYAERTYFSYNHSSVLSLPATVDYVKLTGGTYDADARTYYYVPDGTKLTKGASIITHTSRYYAKIAFNDNGTLSFDGYCAMSKNDKAYFNIEGYHYL